MQIVIDIPEKDVPSRQEIKTINLHFIAGEVCGCNYPYKVLPKGHGDLIDRSKLLQYESWWYHLKNGDIACPKIDIEHAKAIIKADKEGDADASNN